MFLIRPFEKVQILLQMKRIPNLVKTPKETAILQIVNGITKQSEGLNNMSESFSQFSLHLLEVVTEAAPEYVDIIEHVTNVYDDVVQLHLDHAKILERVADDIRDIYERNLVIKRLTNEYNTAENNYAKAKADYQKYKGKSNEANYKMKAKSALEKTKETLKALHDQKQKFIPFVNRRISHAVSFYTVAMTKSCSKEADLMNKAAEIMKSEAIARIEETANNQNHDGNSSQ